MASGLRLPEPCDLFDPANHLLDPLSGLDRLAIALVADGAPVDGGTAMRPSFLSHMGRDAGKANIDKIPLVIPLSSASVFW
jgi:hypothetical protein